MLTPRRPAQASPVRSRPAPRELGVMLPYSPLHHLLLVEVDVRSADERQRLRRADRLPRRGRPRRACPASRTHFCSTTARSRLAPTTRCCAWSRGGRRSLRRSRGYVPISIALPAAAELPLLACGAEHKSTFCVVKGARAWVSPPHRRPRERRDPASSRRHRTLPAAVRGPAGARRPRPAPRVPVDQVRARAARRRLVGVQHHHAHLAACLAEHGEPGRALGAIFDGTGLRHGRDGVGRRAAVGDLWASSARGPAAGAHARRGGGDPPTVADGVRVAAEALGERQPRRCRASIRRLGRGRRAARSVLPRP